LCTDAGARGNPGPAAIAYAIFDSSGSLVEKGARFVGEKTNNEAEYEALLWGLQKVTEMGCVAVRVVTDSELVARQINGQYRTRDERMRRYVQEVAMRKRSFRAFEVVNARRTDERVALVDALVNEELERRGHPKK